jgi:hypothetical protein
MCQEFCVIEGLLLPVVVCIIRGLGKCASARIIFADAQFDLMDALRLSPPIRSFLELSLSQAFRRQWRSAYAAIEEGGQDREWLEHFFIQQIPTQGPQMFSLDGTSWLQPAVKIMPHRRAVYSSAKMLNSRSIGSGQPYFVLAWAPERDSSWAPSLSVRRVPSEQTMATITPWVH